MITLTDVATDLVTGNSYRLHSRLASYLGDELLADDIPAVNVYEENDGTARVPERLTFQVPVEVDALSWVPTEYDSPLGWWGQRIVAQIGIDVGNDNIEWINRGEFVLWSADTADDAVSVECLGLLALPNQARLASEYQPKAAATLKSIVRAMLEPGVTCDLDDAPTDRTAPSYITWGDNRLDNVYNVLDAWPALGQITEEGFFSVTAPLSDPTTADVVFALTEDSTTGTVMKWNASGSREDGFNAVVARGQFPDTAGALAGQEILATAYDNAQESPYRIGGPFSPYMVPFEYASPLMTTQAMVNTAATTRMDTKRRTASRSIQITCVPHPALRLNDAVSITSSRLSLSAALGRIETITLPHQAQGGSMGLTVRLKDAF